MAGGKLDGRMDIAPPLPTCAGEVFRPPARIGHMDHGVDDVTSIAQDVDEGGAREHIGQHIDDESVLGRLLDPALPATATGKQRIQAHPHGFKELESSDSFFMYPSHRPAYFGRIDLIQPVRIKKTVKDVAFG